MNVTGTEQKKMASHVLITIYIKVPIRSTEKCKFACMALLGETCLNGPIRLYGFARRDMS